MAPAHAPVDSLARAVAASIPAGEHRMTVGLRPLDPDQWIEDAPDHDAQLEEKRRVLDARGDVVASLADTGNARRELLDMLAEHLPRRFPDRYRRDAAGIHVQALGETVDPTGRDADPLALAARLVPEDLCLMRAGGDGAYRLVAAALCFPTRWRLAEKMGRPMLAIHAPVPGYEAAVGRPTDHLMGALTPSRPVWRRNWSLLDCADLYQPERIPLARPLEPAELGRRLWLRSERQTLRRLPGCGDVLFTIRIRQCTLDDLCTVPGAAARLLGQVASMPAALKGYKGIAELEPMLLAYLRQHAGD